MLTHSLPFLELSAFGFPCRNDEARHSPGIDVASVAVEGTSLSVFAEAADTTDQSPKSRYGKNGWKKETQLTASYYIDNGAS
jgi:hypothetical protein